MPPKRFMRDYSMVFGGIECVEQLASVFNEVDKYVALNLIINALVKGVKITDVGGGMVFSTPRPT